MPRAKLEPTIAICHSAPISARREDRQEQRQPILAPFREMRGAKLEPTIISVCYSALFSAREKDRHGQQQPAPALPREMSEAKPAPAIAQSSTPTNAREKGGEGQGRLALARLNEALGAKLEPPSSATSPAATR
ncbi:unnamed protein product [Prorocentrum cordatum]|uniref:Uncharacterized protein n=1 Tax=Prorocentrum cordatum TaxID=2364126 RepID=A0ABN9WCE9_9DINO|nr:unnamed protein product [Polarella glacialis]